MLEKETKTYSKRRYAERPCENPACTFDNPFQPHDKRQKFCCTKCRENYHNDKQSYENNTLFMDIKQLRKTDKILQKMYEKYVDSKGYCVVRKEIFHYEGINVMLLTKELIVKGTNGKVKGYFAYGIELHPNDNSFYIIHKIK